MRVLVYSTLYPNSQMPLNAVFVRRRMEAWAAMPGHEITVIAPVPWFPNLPVKTRPGWDQFAAVPSVERPWGYELHHPRYLVTPGVGMRWYGQSMLLGTRKLAQQLHRRHRFDLIDAHYIFPDGEAALQLGRDLELPVVVSSRGTDLNLYPTLPHIRPRLRSVLTGSDQVICVCRELAEVARSLGTPENRLSVIGNGIDPAMFSPKDQAGARLELRLPAEGPVLLSVGHLTERKGFHILIAALDELRKGGVGTSNLPCLVVVGDGPQRTELEGLVRQLGLDNHVRLVGARGQEELPTWYAAADFFLLASSREGWPNVLCEAQAMGLPAVASDAWGISEILNRPDLGVLVAERTAAAFAKALRSALNTNWNREHIASIGGRRTWPIVATEVDRVFLAAQEGRSVPRS